VSGRARAKSRPPPRSHHDAGLTIILTWRSFEPTHRYCARSFALRPQPVGQQPLN